jgi:hypothetical protein
MAHHEAGAHRTADDEYREVPGSAYEHTDANIGAIVKFGIWLVVTALVVHLGMGLLYGVLIEGAKEPVADRRYPLAPPDSVALPPEPRLQASPILEIERFRAAEERRLHEYGWVDKDAGVVHIPVEEAMRLTVQRGLPARADEPNRSGSSPGMLASDASAGRVMEKRRQ